MPAIGFSEIFPSPSIKIPIIRQQIYNGNDALSNEFPHQVLLKHNNTPICGGSILNAMFILTAAHCVYGEDINLFKIVAGDLDLRVTEVTEQIRNIGHIFVHEQYNRPTRWNHDIALLALSQPLILNPESVRAIPIPKIKTTFTGYARVTGWGRTQNGTTSDILKVISTPIVNNTYCRQKYENSITITETMLCVGEDNTRTKSCIGDSGGPVLCNYGTEDETLCGITSFGIQCEQVGLPSVTTDVSHYYDWIKDKMDHYFLMTQRCKKTEFYCPNEDSCLPRYLICERPKRCSNEWIQVPKPTCPLTNVGNQKNFICDNGNIIQFSLVCDKNDDCEDSSDEEKCVSRNDAFWEPSRFVCKSDGRSISKSWLCDDTIDCDDESDEDLMTCVMIYMEKMSLSSDRILCPENKFKCLLQEKPNCIPIEKKCDGIDDCENGEDEWYCY